MKNLIAIVAGDPISVNSEIIAKSWKKSKKSIRKNMLIIGSFDLIKKQFEAIKIKIPLKCIKKIKQTGDFKKLQILDVPIKFNKPFVIKDSSSSKYVLKCIDVAHTLSKNREICGFINCAVDKKKVFQSKFNGMTEYLAKKNNLNYTEVMLIFNKKLSVVPLTTHISLKNVPKKINRIIIQNKILTLNNFFKKFNKKKPKIGVLGLNPHNSEMRKDSEEFKIIRPAVNNLKRKGCKILGPLPSDTIFSNLKKFNFDVIVGMYHDQVLAPFKSLFRYDAINITLGLKYIRVSPDHGVAVDLIKKNKADPESLISCIKFIHSFK